MLLINDFYILKNFIILFRIFFKFVKKLMFNDSHVMASRNKNLGVKIVDNPYNKRQTDPFNTKNVNDERPPCLSKEGKLRLVQKSQQDIEGKLRDISPFYNGKKNENFAPIQQKFVAIVGNKEKFDSIFNYENEICNTNSSIRNKSYNFKKLSDKSSSRVSSKNKTSLNTSMGEIDNGKYNHNWWANKLDEVKVAEKREKMLKNNRTDVESNIFYGKKKFDFEESVSNNRSYMEEFNMKNNQTHKDNIDKKIQNRLEFQNKTLNKITTSIDNSKKDILQENSQISLNEKYSIDYRKERSKIRNDLMEKMRDQISFKDIGRKGIDNYHEMNEKLIKENICPKPPVDKSK